MKKLYVITRKDLGTAYAGVQGGHAVAQWLLETPKQTWNNHTIVYLAVKDEEDLQKWYRRVYNREDNVVEFTEPDLDGQMTAFCCHTRSLIFKSLKLYGV